MTQQKIVVIDDDPDHLLICKLVFERRNYIVLCLRGCDPLDRFVEEVRSFQPDLFFIDYEMPTICGPEAIKILRSQPDLRAVPIIYFSAQHRIDDLAKEVGADDFIRKPFDIPGLLAMARKYTEPNAA